MKYDMLCRIWKTISRPNMSFLRAVLIAPHNAR
jgi:hypothetical protein